jgi:hypothetical protein
MLAELERAARIDRSTDRTIRRNRRRRKRR